MIDVTDEICIGEVDDPKAWVRPVAIERDADGRVRLRATRRDGYEIDRAMRYLGSVADKHGEVFSPAIVYFRTRLGWDWPPVSGKPGEKLKDEVKRGLRALLALAVADGPMTEAERGVLLDYARARADQVQIPLGGGAIEAVEAMIRRMRPSMDAAQYALEKQSGFEGAHILSAWADHQALLVAKAGRLVAIGNADEACLAVFDLIANANSQRGAPAD